MSDRLSVVTLLRALRLCADDIFNGEPQQRDLDAQEHGLDIEDLQSVRPAALFAACP